MHFERANQKHIFAQVSNTVAKNNKQDGVTYSLWKSKKVIIFSAGIFFYRSRTLNMYLNFVSRILNHIPVFQYNNAKQKLVI